MIKSSPVLIYAELLSNIREVSVGCELPTESSPSTRATVSPDGLFFTINHDGVETSIRLPGQVASTKQLPIRSLGKRQLSCRLPLAITPERNAEQDVPWSASDLQPESPITCRTCRATIVEPGTIKVWKDLPSENWAEMMEFWHCHKPHHHGHGHGHGDSLTSKAYGASSKISAQPNVGFVDLTSFLLTERNVSASAITKSTLPSGPREEQDSHDETPENGGSHELHIDNLPVFCESCKTQLGIVNNQEFSISLFKWQVHVNEQIQRDLKNLPSLFHYVSAMLLATMARSGSSKSILLPMKLQDQPAQSVPETNGTTQSLLHIWLFNGNITFSSSKETRSPIPAVKVFYRMISQTDADKLLDSMTSNVQDIILPANAIEKVINALNDSNYLLPQSDRQFQQWKVGLLEKWDGRGV